MPENKVDIDRFAQLSTLLTGAANLDPATAEAYLGRLRAEYPAQVADVLTAFAAIEKDEHLIFELKRRIVEDKALGPLAQKIIAIWYTSEFVGADGKPKTGTQAQFYSGLLWQVIRAHAPTNSKLNYGDWRNPPLAR
jgi:Membrane bound FAD containing D-sorbitol dehydrogenase